jgi:soluble lytic murein transglycosylase-like protein
MRKYVLIIIALIISCPKPGLQNIAAQDYLQEALRVYKHYPLYAYNLLADSLIGTKHAKKKAEILVKLYIEQREYERAAALLDTFGWDMSLTPREYETVLLKAKRWNALVEYTTDSLVKGLAYYHLEDYYRAITFLTSPSPPHDYRMLYLAKAYNNIMDYTSTYAVLMAIGDVNPYLYQEYQDMLFDLFVNLDDYTIVQNMIKKIDKPDMQEYTHLKMYERLGDRKNIQKKAWLLVRTYPESVGAHYAVSLVTPRTAADHQAVGKVYYFHGEYKNALPHLKKAPKGNTVHYYLGMIYYHLGSYADALKHYAQTNWAAAYYYRGRVYEKLDMMLKAVAVYDSCTIMHKSSQYAVRASKRKAFLLEDMGDTLQAVQAFLKINEENTQFRAAMQLYRVGDLVRADTVLRMNDEPDFLYWQVRIRERLGEPVEGIKAQLITEHPLSYYTLVRYNTGLAFDTTDLDTWVRQLGDTAITISRDDSLAVTRAVRYFYLDEIDYAIKELETIQDKSTQDLLYLSRLCALYGADRLSILYSLRVKQRAIDKNIQIFPRGLYELMYPVRYAFTIREQRMDLDLCLAMIWQESLFDPRARSPANAQGIMQIIPSTAKAIAQELGIAQYALYDPSVSIRFGCYYFLELMKDFNSIPLTLAGYNAGPLRVKRWITQDPNYEIDEFIELIPFNETRDYVKRILARRVIYQMRTRT